MSTTVQQSDFDAIKEIQQRQIVFFMSKTTLDIEYRRSSLKRLKKVLIEKEEAICEALFKDFRKSPFESEITEFVIVMLELKRTLKNLTKWTRPQSVTSSIINFPSRSEIYHEPYGNTLIIAPWNYPFQLVMAPLIAAVAAGNTATVKPSELTTHTSNLIDEIINDVFEERHVKVVQGGVDTSQNLLKLSWDYIFFTGSPKVGQIVYEAAVKHLTPVTLELGGKNPCIVDETAKIELAARRIVWGKFVNAGQTCIAPDYLLVHSKIKDEFIFHLKKELAAAYGTNPETSEDFPRIINASNFKRIQNLLKGQETFCGGETNKETLYVAPTLLDLTTIHSEVEKNDLPPIMQEEIFGPILPMITYTEASEIDTWIAKYDKPLALYIFSTQKAFVEKTLKTYAFGGGVVNDVMIQFTNSKLPFGGIGKSGMGAYHGFKSFETFSHKKAIVHKANWLDIKIRYAPYGNKFEWVKKVSKWL